MSIGSITIGSAAISSKARIFIDGHAGTTGLRIREWLAERDDLELWTLDDSERKSESARRKALEEADLTVLCLPDEAAIEAGEFRQDLYFRLDVVRGALGRARDEIRESITSEIPLRTQLAEAQAQIDAYAESVIRGEVAAENLTEMIRDVEREVRVLDVAVEPPLDETELEGPGQGLEIEVAHHRRCLEDWHRAQRVPDLQTVDLDGAVERLQLQSATHLEHLVLVAHVGQRATQGATERRPRELAGQGLE